MTRLLAPLFTVKLPAKGNIRVLLRIEGVPNGDYGFLAAVARTLCGSEWQAV